ncbi:MAG: sulfotransferase, partial [Holophagales bacterium]|nr:sulfotransferase [Holophagales bacterium]
VAVHQEPALSRAWRRLAEVCETLGRDELASAARHELARRTEGREVLVVSGLPRSGTSLMMQMLAAGGVEPYTDGDRVADASNPRGYFEHAAVAALGRSAAFLGDVGGRAVKVVASLLAHLPESYRYRVLFMRRDLDEVLASQRAMLALQGRPAQPTLRVARGLERTLAQVERDFAARPGVALLALDYHHVLDAPETAARRIAAFLSRPLDVAAMSAAVDQGLYRQRLASRGNSD